MSAVDDINDEIDELRRRLDEYGTGPLKARIAALQRRLSDEAYKEAVANAQLAQSLADATLKLEGLYDEAISKLNDYVDAAVAVRAHRPEWDRLWRAAGRAGLVVPARVPDLSARAARDYGARRLIARVQEHGRTDW